MREVAGLFLKLGLVAFGGPAAHVALMRREVVERRGWLSADEFSRMFAACNLVPGPSSTELAIFISYRRAGWRGLVVGGAAFILPAMVLVLLLAIAYTRYGTSRPVVAALVGIRAVVLGIIVWAVIDLVRRLVTRRWLLLLSAGAAVALLLGVSPLVVIVAGGCSAAALSTKRAIPALWLPFLSTEPAAALGRLPVLFLTFLKIGAISFGSGYVLLPLLRDEFVGGLGWLSDRQLLDAVALGQATPGPVFTTATFLGYLFAGVPGALLATLAIFLPAFALVPFLDSILELVRRRPTVQAFVDGANAAAVGLIAGAAILLGRQALIDPLTVLLALGTLGLLLRWPLASPAAIGVGAIAGLTRSLL